MSNRRWDLTLASPRKNSDKKNYTRVGVMFEGKNGGFTLYIDPGVSVSTPEGVYLNAFPPKDAQQGSSAGFGGGRPQQQASSNSDDPYGDTGSDLPF